MDDLAVLPVSGTASLGQDRSIGSLWSHVAALENSTSLTDVLSTIRSTAGKGVSVAKRESFLPSTAKVDSNPTMPEDKPSRNGISGVGTPQRELYANKAAFDRPSLFRQSGVLEAIAANAIFEGDALRQAEVVNGSSDARPGTCCCQFCGPRRAEAGNRSSVSPITDSLSGIAESAPLVNTEVPEVKINFQPNDTPVPNGYIKDTGEAYSATRGYGWVRQDSLDLSSAAHQPLDITPNVRDRNRAGIDPRLNTLVHMQYPVNAPSSTAVKIPAAWEYALPDGTYNVTVSVGDQANSSDVYNSQHRINVEGINAISRFQGNSTQEYKQATVQADVSDGRLTIDAIGGFNTKLNYLEITPTTGTSLLRWDTVTPSPIDRYEGPGTVVNGKLYVFGGFTNGELQATKRVDVYNPVTDKWKRLANMPIAVTHINAAADGQTVWFAGGFKGNHPGPVIDDVWKYHVTSDTWSKGPSLPEVRGGGALVRLGRELHYFGGFKADRSTPGGNHWVLSLEGGTNWTTAAPLPIPRGHLSGAALGGKIYAIGGALGHDSKPVDVDAVHAYDPATNTWKAVASLPIPRSHFEPGTTIFNNRLLIIGGRSRPTGQIGLRDVTEYNPATNTWTALRPLPVPLTAPIAQVIGNQIIVTNGGLNGFSSPQSTTRIGVLDNK